MLEQSALHGRIFRSKIEGKTLASKPVAVEDIAFGPKRPVQVYRISDEEMWMQDKLRKNWYHYQGERGKDLLLTGTYSETEITITDYTAGNGSFYYCGEALYDAGKGVEEEKETHIYFVQNEPEVTYKGVPDINKMPIPLTLQALDYKRVFRYPEKLKDFCKELPACYVDRYKRPIQVRHGHVYPISMEKVTTRWENLPECTYPVVISFIGTRYSVADLEPDHTENDLKHFNQLSGFYEEETPRGGKHKLIWIEDKAFKFQYSKGLEIINESQVTFYGINAKWLSDNPDQTDVSAYQVVGHEGHQITAHLTRPDVSKEVALLRKKAEENFSFAVEAATKLYRADKDDSHGEFIALRTLYVQDIEPYAKQFEKGLLPWILESYASVVIEHRDKHETLRYDLPYLVYLAAIIIGKKSEAKIWENQKCISSEPDLSEFTT